MNFDRLLVAGIVSAFATSAWAQSQTMASGVITLTGQGSGLYDYDIDLTNIGSTGIQTFWFSWIPGANFMPDSPSNISSPSTWTETITSGGGYAIQWKTSVGLAAGDSLDGFQFSSPDSLSVLEGSVSAFGTSYPILTAFVYSGQPLSGTSDQFVVTPSSTPEPSTWLALGGLGLVAVIGRRRNVRVKA